MLGSNVVFFCIRDVCLFVGCAGVGIAALWVVFLLLLWPDIIQRGVFGCCWKRNFTTVGHIAKTSYAMFRYLRWVHVMDVRYRGISVGRFYTVRTNLDTKLT